MSHVTDPIGHPVPTRELEALTGRRRCRVVAVLRNRSDPITVARLAALVAATERDDSDDPESAVRAVEVDLEHVHLPALESAGLIHRGEDGVTAAGALQSNPWLGQLIEREAENRDAVLSCLADERRRTVLEALGDEGGETTVDALARSVAARSVDRSVERVRTALYHRHLPKLAAADLIAYDADDGTIESRSHPELPPFAVSAER